MFNVSKVLVIGLGVLLVSCSSPSVFKITSNPPGSKVIVKNLNGVNGLELGVTPIVLTQEKLESKKFTDGPLVVEMHKDGYETGTVIVSETHAVDVDVFLKLKPHDKLGYAKNYDAISGKLFEAQRLIRIKRYDDALTLLNKLKNAYPSMSVTEELLGSIFYLKKDFKKSLDSFSLAYSKNSDNTFALKMKKLLEKKISK